LFGKRQKKPDVYNVPNFLIAARTGSMAVTTESLESFLLRLRPQAFPPETFLGLLHLLISGSLADEQGNRPFPGQSWRDLASVLKKVRWDPSMVKQMGIDPTTLAPRDRERFWYQAICMAKIDSPEAKRSAQKLKGWLDKFGYRVQA
jgi:hypothetical protein